MNRRDILKSLALAPLLVSAHAVAAPELKYTELPLSNREIFERLRAHLFRPGVAPQEGQVMMHPSIAIYIANPSPGHLYEGAVGRSCRMNLDNIQTVQNWERSRDFSIDPEIGMPRAFRDGHYKGMVGMLFPRPWADDECWTESPTGSGHTRYTSADEGATVWPCRVPVYRVFADPSLGVSQAYVRDPNPVEPEYAWSHVDGVEPGIVVDVFPAFTPDQLLEMYHRRFDVTMPWA